MAPKKTSDVDAAAAAQNKQAPPSLQDKHFVSFLLLLAREGKPVPTGPFLPNSEENPDDADGAASEQRSASGRARSQSLSAAGSMPPIYQIDDTVSYPLQLVSYVAKSLGCETYWTNLKQQILVDDHVEFIRFCADNNYTASKTIHVLQWLTQMRWLFLEAGKLITSGEASKFILQEEAGADTPHDKEEKASDEKSTKKQKQPKRSASSPRKSTNADGESSIMDPASPGTSVSSPAASKPKTDKTRLLELLMEQDSTLEAVAQAELRSFVEKEMADEFKWGRMAEQLSHPSEAAQLAATTKGKKGGNKNDKAKQQQLQQLELEEEQIRQAAAALPSENIYLTKHEIAPFLKRFVIDGLIQHKSLYQFCEDEPQCEGKIDQQTISVCVESLFPILPLHEGKEVVDPAADEPAEDKASSSVKKPAAGKGAKKPVEEEEKPKEVVPVLTPMETFRAEQEKELAILRRKHDEAEEVHAFHQKTAQVERDMQLLFDREGTQRAAVDVYESLEGSLTEREFRILQRVEALEVTLGIRPDPRQKSPPPSASGKRKSTKK